MTDRPWIAWAGATVLILLVTAWPPSIYRAQPQWDAVRWLPLADMGSWPSGPAANLLLFLPFGYLGARCMGASRRSALAAVGLAVVLSFLVETAQLFAPGRYPSTTDVVANGAGAALGAALARRGAQRDGTAR